VLIGTTLSTISIVQAIPSCVLTWIFICLFVTELQCSEILPLKYRALANGFAFLAGSFGGNISSS
jgi:hypothetical protein